jgi:hypothetical protein
MVFSFAIAAFAHKFFHKVHEGIELGTWNRRIVLNCRNDFTGGTETRTHGGVAGIGMAAAPMPIKRSCVANSLARLVGMSDN